MFRDVDISSEVLYFSVEVTSDGRTLFGKLFHRRQFFQAKKENGKGTPVHLGAGDLNTAGLEILLLSNRFQLQHWVF